MELCKLEKVTLKKANKEKQTNGVYKDTYFIIDIFDVWIQSLDDEVSANIYGANLYKVKRLKTPKKDLETFLISKTNNSNDNISKYVIEYDDNLYKINDAKKSGVTIERL